MRAVPEWVGKSPDQAIPPRVRLRVFERANKRCQKCTRLLETGKWAVDHIRALVNGGTHSEANFQALCVTCHSDKSLSDVREKSRTYRVKSKHYGIKGRKRTMPYRKFDGTIVPSRYK